MSENYATSINQKTGKKEYYKTKQDYINARMKKSNTSAHQRRRILG